MKQSPHVHRPCTLDEAFDLRAERGASARLLAGGTDLMVLLNARLLDADEFIDLWPIRELRGIEDLPQVLRIGALTTYTQLIRSPLVEQHAPALAAAARTIGAAQIQNRGTIGGNIANGSPAGDSLPVLSAFDAEIEIQSRRGSRRISIHSFYSGYRQTILDDDELIVAVLLPKLREGERSSFIKVGTRRAQAISKVMLGARWRVSGGVIEDIALSYGSVAPTVIRAGAAETALRGQTPTPATIGLAIEALDRDIRPISDLRSTAQYRRRVAENLLARLIRRSSSP